MSYVLEINSEEYPEWVVRNSLYWMSELSAWELESSERGYQIRLKNSSEECICKLHRLLNDFKLRSKLMDKTQSIREKIIMQALQSVEEGGK
ncbi:His-Xaa-Ser system protein HxsD [Halomonas piscis]|uniref:His-Xaa-Ser system protein HxsD n=1 Tax=Halomonas piscis TaxID=3031727 RepID=UPI00289C967A|nr:His-Xaa-Ser system protein HxsD [Halomonas piscis]